MKILSEKEFLKKLCSFPHRKTPSELGDKAAKFIIEEIEKIGLEPKTEKVRSSRFSVFWYTLGHFIALFIFSLLFMVRPSFSYFILFLLFLVSLFILWRYEMSIFSFLGKILSGESKNILVKIPARGKQTKRFILSAHYDTAHQSIALSPIIGGVAAKTLGRFAEKFPPGLSLSFFLPNIALGFTLFFMISQLLGFTPTLIFNLQVAAMIILLMTIIFMLQLCTSPYVPGALDNGGGVAVLYGLGKKIKKSSLKSIEVWLLFNSCEENGLRGVKDFLDDHSDKLDKETTFFINIDGIGAEVLHYLTAEADLFGTKHVDDLFLVTLSELLDNQPEFKKVTPFFLPVPSDATEIINKGFRCLTISSSNRDGYYPHYHQLTDTFDKVNMDNIYLAEKFVLELVEKVDQI